MRFIALLLCFSFIAPIEVGAQFSANSLIETDLSITSEPEYPAPGEAIQLSLNDYSGGVSGATVEWLVDNSPIPNSTNQRNITLFAAEAGETQTVRTVLTKSDGVKTTLTKTFQPLYVDIIIEPETHVPGFFAGRPLPSVGSTVHMTALLDNGAPMGQNFVYLWRVNQTVLEGGPIRGRNKISFTMPQDSYSVVSLQVSRPDGAILSKKSTIVSLVAPQINFYEVNALYGIETKSLQSFNMVGNSATLKAEPYYLDSNTFNAPNILEWTIDGDTAAGDSNNPYNITLEKTGYPGSAELNFQVQNTTSFLQGARGSININI